MGPPSTGQSSVVRPQSSVVVEAQPFLLSSVIPLSGQRLPKNSAKFYTKMPRFQLITVYLCSMKGRFSRYITICMLCFAGMGPALGQLGFDLDIKKPEQYEKRELRAEKSGSKKFNLPRRFFQNNFTHYNYFFNANNKINEVIARAKEAHKEDYTRLLPFYNYSLDVTAAEKTELDSVIYKAKTGIVLHDLRNDWADDLYFLWGAAYYLQQEYDSAYQMFQFINYAFAEKEKDGFYKFIGSRIDGNRATSISTNEKVKFPKGLISDPPVRNYALIWEVRSLIQAGGMTEAGSLISLLKNDPLFPERLQDELEEVQAYWFYKQSRWDSAAHYLTKALPLATTGQERARWEYLSAQMYERAGENELAKDYYNRSTTHSTDPVMDIHARLNLIRINKEGGDDYIDENIADLMRMARREKYVDYRDVIYYMAGQMELARNNLPAAQMHFMKAALHSKSGNAGNFSQGYLQLADVMFRQRKFAQAASFYDSVRTDNLSPEEATRIAQRKEMLGRFMVPYMVVQRQDSLQRIAAMPEEERADYIRKLLRQMRRLQGLSEEGTESTTALANTPNTDLFRTAKGEWYFYNEASRKQGVAAFKQTWRNRPNVDNWRRFSNVVAQMRNTLPENTRGAPGTATAETPLELTYEAFLNNLPLSDAALKRSNDSIATAMIRMAKMYTEDFEDDSLAIATLESLRARFPEHAKNEELLFQLYYSYVQTGNQAKAAEIKNLLNNTYPNGRYAAIINTGVDPQSAKPSASVTKTYEDIYNLFVEGRFDEALAAKHFADSTHKTNYWSPQLLYIEAVYYIKQRQDSLANQVLNTLIQQSDNIDITRKAMNLQEVLSRRAQIERELMAYQIKTPEPEPEKQPEPIRERTQEMKKDTAAAPKSDRPIPQQQAPPVRKDTVTARAAPSFVYKPEGKHFVLLVLTKVDAVFGNEVKNAFDRYNRANYYNRTLTLTVAPITPDHKLMVVSDFPTIQSAVDYVQKAKPIAGSQIIPWLARDKYSFTIISENNLPILQQNGDLEGYKRFLDQNLPVKL